MAIATKTEAEMIETFVQQLQIVLLGASCWKDKPSRPLG